MNQQDQLLLKKLLHKAKRECGLHDIDHRRLTRLIEQADAEEALLITGESPGKDIFSSRSGESALTPRSPIKTKEARRWESVNSRS